MLLLLFLFLLLLLWVTLVADFVGVGLGVAACVIDSLTRSLSGQSHFLASRLCECLFMQNQSVIAENQIPEAMYFIRKGRVGVSKSGTKFGSHSEGSYIGELPFLFPLTVRFQPCLYLAESIAVEAYQLAGPDFSRTCSYFPDLLVVMRLVAKQRIQKLHLQRHIATEETDPVFLEQVKREERAQGERISQLNHLFSERKSVAAGEEAKDGEMRSDRFRTMTHVEEEGGRSQGRLSHVPEKDDEEGNEDDDSDDNEKE